MSRRHDDHRHTFEFERASKQDVIAGTNKNKIVVCTSLGSAAGYDADTFATAEQGRRIDEVHAKLSEAHDTAKQAKTMSSDVDKKIDNIKKVSEETKQSLERISSIADEAKRVTEQTKQAIKDNESEIATIKNCCRDNKSKLSDVESKIDSIKDESDKAVRAVDGLGKLSKKDKIGLDDLDISGTKDSDHVLSGSGWVAMPKPEARQDRIPAHAQLSESDRDKLNKIDDLEATVAQVKSCCEQPNAAQVQQATDIQRVEKLLEHSLSLSERAEQSSKDSKELFAVTKFVIGQVNKRSEATDKKSADAKRIAEESKSVADTAATKADNAYNLASTASQEAKSSCQEAKSTSTRAEEKATSAEAKVSTLEGTVNQHTSEIEQLKKDTKDASDKATAVDAKVSALEVASTDATKAKEALDSIRDKLSEAENTANSAKTISDQSKTLSDQTKARVDGFEARISSVENKANESVSTSKRAEEKSISCETTSNQAKNIADDAKSKVTALEGKINNFEAQVTSAKTEAKEAKECCDELRPQITEAKAKAQSAQDEIKKFEASINQAKAMANAASTAARNAGSSSAAASASAQAANTRSTTAVNTAQAANTKALQVEQKVSDLEQKISDSKKCCDDLKPRVTSLEGKVSTVENKLSQVDGKVTASDAKIKTVDDKASRAEQKAQQALDKASEAKPAAAVTFYNENKMGTASEFDKLLRASRASMTPSFTQAKIDDKLLAGFDYESKAVRPARSYDSVIGWVKDLKDIAVQSSLNALNIRECESRISVIEDTMSVARLTVLSHDSQYLVAKPVSGESDRRRLILKAGTVLSFPSDRKKGHLVFNTDHEISHGVGAVQDQFTPGTDHYVFALVDWDRVPSPPEVTFSIQPSIQIPAGYDRDSALLIGGFHTLCADATRVQADHKLVGYKAGDILPASVWCSNHRPTCKPQGMVYNSSSHVWVDIYLQSGSGGNTMSGYNRTAYQRNYNDHVKDLAAVGKRLPSDAEFSTSMLGIPDNTKMADSTTTKKTGGHTGTNGIRLLSNIGCEDGIGFFSQYLDAINVIYVPASGSVPHYYDFRCLTAGGSYKTQSPGVFSRFMYVKLGTSAERVGARGYCDNRGLSK